MSADALDAYQDVEKSTLSGRELEAAVLMRAAQMLAEVQNQWDAPDRDERLDQALRHNQRLWTLFQAELLAPDHPMSDELKQNLLTLAAFIDKRTFDALAFPEPGKLDILIAINKNIAAGLRGDSGNGA